MRVVKLGSVVFPNLRALHEKALENLTTEPSISHLSSTSTADRRSDETLADKAERCRRLASGISDRQAADVLRVMALQYEESASHLKS